MEPTYLLFPEANEEQKKDGWSYNCNYLDLICSNCEEWGSSWEQIEEVLLSIENSGCEIK